MPLPKKKENIPANDYKWKMVELFVASEISHENLH